MGLISPQILRFIPLKTSKNPNSRTHTDLKFEYPTEVTEVPVQRHCRAISFLHGAGWKVPVGTQIGQYVITYDDNQRETVRLVYGENIDDCWLDVNKPPALVASTKVAWAGTNPHSVERGMEIQLYRFRWENPKPHIMVKSISFKSSMKAATPFLVAITLEP